MHGNDIDHGNRLDLALAAVVVVLSLTMAGSWGYADAIDEESVQKIETARQASDAPAKFFRFGPLQCRERKRFGTKEWVYSGWIIEKSDALRPTGACIYRKLI